MRGRRGSLMGESSSLGQRVANLGVLREVQSRDLVLFADAQPDDRVDELGEQERSGEREDQR